jgi:hypothetical protein
MLTSKQALKTVKRQTKAHYVLERIANNMAAGSESIRRTVWTLEIIIHEWQMPLLSGDANTLQAVLSHLAEGLYYIL